MRSSHLQSLLINAREGLWNDLGMTYNPEDDFDDPDFPEDHRLRKLVLYRIRKQDHICLEPSSEFSRFFRNN